MNSLFINRVGIIALGLYVLFLWQCLVFTKLAEAALILCVVVSLASSVSIRKSRVHYSPDDRLFVLAFLLFVLGSLFALLINPISDQTLVRNELLLTFLLIVPFYYLMRVADIKPFSTYWGFGLAALLAGIFAVIQLVYWNATGEYILTSGNSFAEFPGRPSGGVNPMRFGAITLCLAVISLNGLLFLKGNTRVKQVWLVAGVVSALIGCILTQARGAWLAIPVLAIAYLIYLGKQWPAKRLWAVFFVILVVIGSVVSTPQFQQRFNEAISNIQSYQKGNANTSLGARFDMAKAAWVLIKEKPVLGHGLGSYKDLATEIRLANPGMSREVGMWKNPHNEILLVMVERGIPGLISLVFLFGALGFVYWKYAWREDTAFYAVSGLGILIVYGVAGQSVALFEHEPFTYFFASTQALLMARMLKIVHGVKRVENVAST
ncbi:O-antigen ligase family protein [Saccharospirillum impatiens]|uniref:O-antigen ligase family protein n=1 Tax=Saccharospirillum impatiens TaxID=169438 RepID=UPI0003F6DF45|nr:O-antigen ligase family protein [Saccharospirillum impatiens]